MSSHKEFFCSLINDYVSQFDTRILPHSIIMQLFQFNIHILFAPQSGAQRSWQSNFFKKKKAFPLLWHKNNNDLNFLLSGLPLPSRVHLRDHLLLLPPRNRHAKAAGIRIRAPKALEAVLRSARGTRTSLLRFPGQLSLKFPLKIFFLEKLLFSVGALLLHLAGAVLLLRGKATIF